MIIKNVLSALFSLLILLPAFAQPSEAALKKRVYATNKGSNIVEIEFEPAIEKRIYSKNLSRWQYLWSRKYFVTAKTKYPGITHKLYGGVQYERKGSSCTYTNMLGGGSISYIGIPNPSKEFINKYLKENYDPLEFFGNTALNHIIEAPNKIRLAEAYFRAVKSSTS